MKKKFVGVFALLAIGLLLSTATASAFGPRWFENSDELHQAIEDGDYDTWKELRVERLTEERFEEVQERHQERQERMQGEKSLREAIEDADYGAYSEAVLAIHPEASVISESDFEILVELHQARMSGDMDLVEELQDDIDFAPGMFGHGKGSFMGKGSEMGQGFGMHNRGVSSE